MIRRSLAVALIVAAALAPMLLAQVKTFTPVTDQMLLNPSSDDWLMYSRTYDAQRFSPLNQIDKQNVGQLQKVWSNALPNAGTHESIPIVYQGVMYVVVPGCAVQALDATNGKLIWEYKREGTQKAQKAQKKTTLCAFCAFCVPSPSFQSCRIWSRVSEFK